MTDEKKNLSYTIELDVALNEEAEGFLYIHEVLPPESSIREQVAQGLKENGAYRDLYRSALAEQVDANMSNREFALRNISVEAARVTIGALPHIRESMDNAEKEYQRKQQEVIDRVYANEK